MILGEFAKIGRAFESLYICHATSTPVCQISLRDRVCRYTSTPARQFSLRGRICHSVSTPFRQFSLRGRICHSISTPVRQSLLRGRICRSTSTPVRKFLLWGRMAAFQNVFSTGGTYIGGLRPPPCCAHVLVVTQEGSQNTY